MTVRTQGFLGPITPQPWGELLDHFDGLAAQNTLFDPLAAIIHSVIESGDSDALAASTSMHDLIVVTAPPPEPPFDVLRISVAGSLQTTADGQVRIRHLTVSGHDDDITRTAGEAVNLFWRFVAEKFGVLGAR